MRRRAASPRRGSAPTTTTKATPNAIAAAPTWRAVDQAASSLHATTPPKAIATSEHAERDDRAPHERRIREPCEHDVADEQRQRDEGDSPVRRSELEHCADDHQRDRDSARHGGGPEQHARRDRRAARQVRARDAAHAASSGGRSGALRWSRTAPRRSCSAAAGTSRTTPAYRPARGRSPHALRSASSSAR